MLYLRFTKDAQRDLDRKRSVWIDPNMDEADADLLVDGMPAKYHVGLCGHKLEAETVEEALEEVRAGAYYMDVEKDSWAIFEGEPAPVNDTPEGDTFAPVAVLHVNVSASKFDSAY